MIGLMIRLKLTLIRNSWRVSIGQRIGLVVGGLFGLWAAGLGVVLMLALRFAADDTWAAFGTLVAGSLLVLGWSVVPILVSGVDETLDPARFALLPLRARQLAPGLLVAGLIGVPGIVTSLVALASLVTWSRGVLPLLLAVPAAALGVLTCVLASRLLTTAAARLLAARRSREMGAVLTVLLLSTIGVWPALLSHRMAGRSFSADDATRIADVLGWLPFGLPWAAPGDAATGHAVRGVIRLVLAAALVAGGTYLWSVLLDRALVDQADGGGTRARVGGSLLDRLPATPMWAITARSLRYWRRDPRYLVGVLGVLVGGTVPIIAIASQPSSGPKVILLGAGPLVGSLLGLTTSNDLGTDGSAFGAHVLVGVPGRVDRAGRIVALLVWGVPLALAVSLTGAAFSGRFELWPGSFGAALAGLLAGLGASGIAAALVPYPVPEAGSNPFRSTNGGNARSALGQAAVMSATGVATLPAIGLLVVSVVWWAPAAWFGLLVGPLLGAAVLVTGLVIAGRLMDARGPEILASIRRSL